MRRLVLVLSASFCAVILLVESAAQQPAGKPGQENRDYSNSTLVTAILAFDKDKTGKVAKAQITDMRLHRLFDMADTNKDGVVTRDELTALAGKLEAEFTQSGGGKGGPDGFGKGGKGGKGKGDKGKDGPGKGGPGKGGPGGFGKGGPPQPGQILQPSIQDTLKLTPGQRKQLEDLQKDVDSRLGKILTDEQKTQLKELRDRGPGKGGPAFGPIPEP